MGGFSPIAGSTTNWKALQVSTSLMFGRVDRSGPSTWLLRSTGYGSTSEETQWTITKRWVLSGMEKPGKHVWTDDNIWLLWLLTVPWFIPCSCCRCCLCGPVQASWNLSSWEMLPNWISKQSTVITDFVAFTLRPFKLNPEWRSLGSGSPLPGKTVTNWLNHTLGQACNTSLTCCRDVVEGYFSAFTDKCKRRETRFVCKLVATWFARPLQATHKLDNGVVASAAAKQAQEWCPYALTAWVTPQPLTLISLVRLHGHESRQVEPPWYPEQCFPISQISMPLP